jgi:monoamine oxidase
VYSGNYEKTNVLIIGAGAAGLGAAQEAIKQGLSYRIIEARDRLGGRVNTQDLGPYKVDLGASWIHGIGPGCGDDEEWENKENPIYTIAKENGIENIPTWRDEDESKNKFYWFKNQEQELDEDRVDKLNEEIEGFIEAHNKEADVKTSFQDVLKNFEVDQDKDTQCIYNAVLNQMYS